MVQIKGHYLTAGCESSAEMGTEPDKRDGQIARYKFIHGFIFNTLRRTHAVICLLSSGYPAGTLNSLISAFKVLITQREQIRPILRRPFQQRLRKNATIPDRAAGPER